MNDIQKLQDGILNFRNERDWKKFHTKKDLIMALMIESSELAEHALWDRTNSEYTKKHKENIEDEFADVMHYLLLIADAYDIDIVEACERKLEKTKLKYPVGKSKGNTIKHTLL